MIRVWYVSKYAAPPGFGSVGGRGFCLMNEIAMMGCDVAVISSDSNHLISPPYIKSRYLFEKIGNIHFCWVNTVKYLHAKSAKRILSWLHFEWRLLFFPKNALFRPDVIVVSSLSLLTIINGLYWRYKFRCGLIFEVRDIWPLTIVEEGGFKSWNPFVFLLSFVEKIGYKYSDAIVGTMPNLREHVQNVLGCCKHVYCIPMGLDYNVVDPYVPLPNSFIEKYFSKDKFIVAYVGTVGITNALETFFECARIMEGEGNIQFLVVGDGDLRVKYISRYGDLKNLLFAPKVEKRLVQAVLERCDLLYLSAYRSEVWRFGQSLNKLIDYMAAGKPVVASYTGFQSMINEAESGTFVDAENVEELRNAILKYYRMNPNERQAIGERGKKWILNHRQYRALAGEYFSIMRKYARGVGAKS